ncbi:MAG TPA: 50S ribosomal protein L32 [Candidatus Omnitrophica bacterium]|nr:50S ribosomal protein L32 [Candidatus Omnitrophota bacterium]
MAHPKRRHSPSRTRKKRTHKKLSSPQLVECKQCGRFKKAHIVCPFCGYYAQKQVVQIKKKEKKR